MLVHLVHIRCEPKEDKDRTQARVVGFTVFYAHASGVEARGCAGAQGRVRKGHHA